MEDKKQKIKKGSKILVEIEKTIFPHTGISHIDDNEIRVKNVLPGQKVKVLLKKKKKNYFDGRLLEIIEKSPFENSTPACDHYQDCGGCNRQTIEYDKQLELKYNQVKRLFENEGFIKTNFKGITASPRIFEYRNKMEFSFGDLNKDGVLQLGMHPRGRRFDVVTVDTCYLVDEDFRKILSAVLEHFREYDFNRYHIISRQGYLRNLVIRKGLKTGEILVNLITTSQGEHDYKQLTEYLKALDLEGELVGFLQSINNDYADDVKCEKLITHYGRSYFYEELLDLKFKITPFAFFQPNTFAAEELYKIILNLTDKKNIKIIFDLYCGTGTISQTVASNAEKVYGIEIIEEAVQMAKENTDINNIDNCNFISGDVFEKVDLIEEKPDLIIMDPPRPGINPKAIQKIIDFDSREIIYVSCNPKSLVRDLEEFTNNHYRIVEIRCVDMFPHTHHIETVVHLEKMKRMVK